MKRVITIILRQGEGQRFHQDLAISSTSEPEEEANKLLTCKNLMLLEGEERFKLIRVRDSDAICYSHDWRVKGDHFMCRDCKVPGIKETPFGKIVPKFQHPQYKDCSWKIQM